MEAILGSLGVFVVIAVVLGALYLADDADWVGTLEERLARGEISEEQYRTIQRTLLGAGEAR